MSLKEIELSNKFHPLFEGKYTYYGFYGGRSSGKSYAVATYAILQSMKKHERILTVRQFKNSLDRSSYDLYINRIQTFGLEQYFDINARQITNTLTGTSFNFVGVDRNLDSIKSYFGITITIIEEAQSIEQESLDILVPTVLREPGSKLIAVWNPQSKTDAIDRFFRGKHKPDNSFYTMVGWQDNKYLSKEAEQLRQNDLKKDYNRYLHIWEGEYRLITGVRIYNNFEIAELNIEDKYKPIFGVDFGAGSAESTIAKVYYFDDVIYIADEFKEVCWVDVLASKIKEKLLSHPDSLVVCDSNNTGNIERLRGHPHYIRAIPVVKKNWSVTTSIDWIASKKIVINPKCVKFIDEIENYGWKVAKNQVNEDGSLKILNEPNKLNDHLMDAMRYALMSTSEYITGEFISG